MEFKAGDRKIAIDKKRTIFFTFLSILVLFLMVNFIGIEELVQNLQELSLVTILAIFLIISLDFIIRSYRWYKILKLNPMSAMVNYKNALKGIIMAHTFNSYLPGRIGELSKLSMIKKDKIPYSVGISSIVSTHVFDFASIFILGFISISYLVNFNIFPVSPEISFSIVILPLAMFITTILFILFLLKNPKSFVKLFGKINKTLATKIESIINLLTSSFENTFNISNKNQLLIILIQSLGIWLLESFILVILFYNYSLPVIFEIILIASLVGNISFIFPILPGNFGSYELVVGSVLFLGTGIQLEFVLSIVLIGHLLFTVNSTMLGIPIIFFEGINPKWKKIIYK